MLGCAELPASVEAGWLRHQEISEDPYKGADGAVLFNHNQRILCLILDSTTSSARSNGLIAQPLLLC
jgi:hypothetical protein